MYSRSSLWAKRTNVVPDPVLEFEKNESESTNPCLWRHGSKCCMIIQCQFSNDHVLRQTQESGSVKCNVLRRVAPLENANVLLEPNIVHRDLVLAGETNFGKIQGNVSAGHDMRRHLCIS